MCVSMCGMCYEVLGYFSTTSTHVADAAARHVRRFVDQLQLHICGVRGSKNAPEALYYTPDVNKARVRGRIIF